MGKITEIRNIIKTYRLTRSEAKEFREYCERKFLENKMPVEMGVVARIAIMDFIRKNEKIKKRA